MLRTALWCLLLASPAAALPSQAGASASTVAAGATALTERAARLIERSRQESQVQQHLQSLCLEIGPRLTGSQRLAQAQEWARARFESYGLTARLERWGEFAVGFDRGVQRGVRVGAAHEPLVFSTAAWTPGTHGVRRRPAALAPRTLEELESRAAALASTWLVWPDEERPSRALREALAELDLAGEISPSRGELVHTGGNPNVKWDSLPTRVRIRLRADQHADLVARLERGEAVELEFEIDNRFVEGPIPQHNVVADWIGATRPDEYVIVSAHLDSWDGAQGAQDNGTGVATTLEAARLIAASGLVPARTIRFILWTGEEQGLLGSKAWVEAHAAELDKISAVFNHDEGTNYLAGLETTPEMRPALEAVCAPLFDLDLQMPFRLREVEGLSPAMSSDQAAFVQRGVPGFFWIQEGRTDYNHIHHTQHDLFETAVPEYQRHSALVVALVALGTADLEELLDRTNMEPLPPRRMGVDLEGTRLTAVLASGPAKRAGWQVGDEIVSIDGTQVATRAQIVERLQQGGPHKRFVLRRGADTIESSLDYGDDPDEKRRGERAARRRGKD